MAKMKVKDLAAQLIQPFLEENDLELFNIEYVREGKERYLRVYIDKPYEEGGEERYVGIDECELVSRFLSDKLDETDPIEDNYILEVSSPGIDRPLIHDRDYVRYAGRLVDVSLYKAMNGMKQLCMELAGKSEGKVQLKDEKGDLLEIPEEQISKIRLTVII